MKNDLMATNSNTEIFVVGFSLWTNEFVRHKWWKWKIKNHLDFQDVEKIRIKERRKKEERAICWENNKENDIVEIIFFGV